MAGKMPRPYALEGRHRRHGQSIEPQGAEVEKLITDAGAQLRYLPPYSPDMNPIEKAYSKLKAFLRKIAERTVAGLINTLHACADIFKTAECANYFKACGYDTD
jgi:transposase